MLLDDVGTLKRAPLEGVAFPNKPPEVPEVLDDEFPNRPPLDDVFPNKPPEVLLDEVAFPNKPPELEGVEAPERPAAAFFVKAPPELGAVSGGVLVAELLEASAKIRPRGVPAPKMFAVKLAGGVV